MMDSITEMIDKLLQEDYELHICLTNDKYDITVEWPDGEPKAHGLNTNLFAALLDAFVDTPERKRYEQPPLIETEAAQQYAPDVED